MIIQLHKTFKKQYEKLTQAQKKKFKERRSIFLQDEFNPILNNHALKQILGANKFLKQGQTFKKLDIIAYSHSDNEWAEIMREEERKLFQEIREEDRQDGSQRKL